MKRVFKNVVLPSELLLNLDGLTKGVEERNCLRILEKVTLHDAHSNFQNNYDFTPIPQSWFKTVIGSHYNKPLNVLLDNGIVERTDTFGVGNCFKYRINPAYIGGEVSNAKYYYNIKEDSPYYINSQEQLQPFISNFDRLHIPFEKMYEAIDHKVDSLSLSDYDHDMDINWPYPPKCTNYARIGCSPHYMTVNGSLKRKPSTWPTKRKKYWWTTVRKS